MNSLGNPVELSRPDKVCQTQQFFQYAIVSDSALCTIGPQGHDWTGQAVQACAKTPIFIQWGAGLVNRRYRRALSAAWKRCPGARRIAVLTAGNDLLTAAPDALLAEARAMRTYWSDWNVELVFLDIVPPAWQDN